jgi:hypothetical protein
MACVHNGYFPMPEILNNLSLIRSVWQCVNDDDFSPRIKLFHLQINSNHRMALPSAIVNTESSVKCRPSSRIQSPSDELQTFASRIAITRSFSVFNTLMYGSLRMSAYIEKSISKTADDCIMYMNERSADTNIGFILAILHLNQTNELYLIVRPVQCTSYADSLVLDKTVHYCSNVITGYMKVSALETVRPKRVIQKLSYRLGKPVDALDIPGSFYFFQFPNLMEST